MTRTSDLDVASAFREHGGFVWRCLKRHGVPASALEDATQDVFVLVHRKRHEYRETGSLRGWLFVLARGVAHNAIRKHRPTEPVPDRPGDVEAGLEAALERREGAEIMRRFLESLDEDKRMTFWMMEMEGMSAPEVAEACGVPVNTVYSRLRITRERLTRLVERTRAAERTPR